MESKARLFGHPIHQMLVVFPLGLLATAVIFDLIFLFSGSEQFSIVAYWMIVAGIIGGLVAAPFGLIDFVRVIPGGTRAKRIGAMHGLGNVVLLLLFGASAWMRSEMPESPSTGAYICSFAGALLALVTGWLGGELVDRLGVGTYERSGPDAPSSLRERHP